MLFEWQQSNSELYVFFFNGGGRVGWQRGGKHQFGLSAIPVLLWEL